MQEHEGVACIIGYTEDARGRTVVNIREIVDEPAATDTDGNADEEERETREGDEDKGQSEDNSDLPF
jgi:hypothetical protein